MQGVKNGQKDTQGMEYKRCYQNFLITTFIFPTLGIFVAIFNSLHFQVRHWL